jgi:hypothetical protein
VVKQIIGITLFLFFSSSSMGSFEELSASFDADSQTSLWTLDSDFSSETARRRSLKRSQRSKSSSKSLPAVDKAARAISLVVRIREASFISQSSKSSVYQQINVYRI